MLPPCRTPLLALAIFLASAAPAFPQQIVGAAFQLPDIDVTDLATGFDGDVVATGKLNDSGDIRTFWFHVNPPLRNGGLLDNITVVEPETNNDVSIAALARGGYAAAWRKAEANGVVTRDVFVRRVNPNGSLIGVGGSPVAPDQQFTERPGIAPFGGGFVMAWSSGGTLYGRRFDSGGGAVGGSFPIGNADIYSEVQLRALPSGGLLAVWGANDNTSARLLQPDLTPAGPTFLAASSFNVTDVAVSPDGTVAVIVGRPFQMGTTPPTELRMRIFAVDGSSVSSDITVRALDAGSVMGRPAVEFGEGGDLLVLWGERTTGIDGIYARLFNAAGTPTAPVRLVTSASQPGQARLTRRADGTFLVAWNDKPLARGAIVTICAPGTNVCGDGVLTSTCEVCDDGAGNSNVVADACRTDCRRAHCGDGVTDAGEACDDGNGVACDGCNEFCEIEPGTVCGDGTIAPFGCGEQCDDGNVGAGDGCSATCTVERAIGGGSQTTDCYAVWRIDNPSNDPLYDTRGHINARQRCRDNDPACDFDGGTSGSCTFHLAVCVNNTGLSPCGPARLLSWELGLPSEKQALVRPALAAVRAALTAAVVPNVVGSGDADECSPDAEVVVPLRGTPGAYKLGKLKLKSTATVYSEATDKDTLLLRCDP